MRHLFPLICLLALPLTAHAGGDYTPAQISQFSGSGGHYQFIVTQQGDRLLYNDYCRSYRVLIEPRKRTLHDIMLPFLSPNDHPEPHETEAASASLGSLKNDAPVALPDVAVHVYELPDLPSTRRVRVLSEQELMQGIRDKLLPHLSNAVAGMVRQALQKKLAMLSYDLQTMLNEETPQLVEDVLDHNLNAIFRSVKDAAAFKK